MPIQLEEATKIPKRPAVSKDSVGELLIKTHEIVTNEMVVQESQENNEGFIREPPVSHPLPLMQSQEANFESVEKLQTQLEFLVGGEGETNNMANHNHKDITGGDDDKQTSPLRGE